MAGWIGVGVGGEGKEWRNVRLRMEVWEIRNENGMRVGI